MPLAVGVGRVDVSDAKLQSALNGLFVYTALASDLGIVPNALQKPVDNSGGPSGTSRNFTSAIGIDSHRQKSR